MMSSIVTDALSVPPEGASPKIEHTESPRHPQFHFEWHPQSQKVYIGCKPGKWEDGVYVPGDYGHLGVKVLAEHCDHHARFLGFVQTYLRGYDQAVADVQWKLKSQRLKIVKDE